MIKEIDIAGALKRIADGSDQVCMLVPISMTTTVEELMKAEAFVLMDDKPKEEKKPEKEKPKKKPAAKKKVDTGKILALHKAGWNLSSICLETGESYYTVKKTIDQEKENDGAADS